MQGNVPNAEVKLIDLANMSCKMVLGATKANCHYSVIEEVVQIMTETMKEHGVHIGIKKEPQVTIEGVDRGHGRKKNRKGNKKGMARRRADIKIDGRVGEKDVCIDVTVVSMETPPNTHVFNKSGNTFNVARGLKNKINNYAKIQNLAPNLIVLPMVFDTYRNMDVKSEEFCTVLFGRLMSQSDRRYPFKLANFRQRLSLVVARAVARQALSYMQSGACVAYEVSNDDLFILSLKNIFD